MNEDIDRELLQVDALLRRAASSLAYPPTPDIASGVRVALNEPASRSTGIGSFWQRPAFTASGLLAALMIVLGALVAVPTSRTAMADFFGLSHISFFQDDEGASPTPPVLSPDSFARPSSVDEVRGIVDFPVVLPYPDEPDAVYIQGEEFNEPYALFVFDDYDLYETRDANIQKLVHGSAPVTELSFDGHPAYWVDAGGHIVQSLDAEGRVVIETRRSVDRATLVWEQDGITYRIESSLPQDNTMAVAQSLR